MARTWISRVVFTPLPPSEEVETTAWVNAVIANGGSVSSGRRTLVDTLIAGLKTDGIWSKLDRLWLLMAENSQSALTDLVANALATVSGSPTFTANYGYTGVASGYINTGYNPAVNGTNYVQNSAHLSGWAVTAGAIAAGFVGQEESSSTATIRPRYADDNVYARINEGSSGGQGVVPGGGFWIGSRVGASLEATYWNGALFASPNATSGSVPNNVHYLLTLDSSGSQIWTFTMGMASMGGGLTATEAAKFYDRLRNYMMFAQGTDAATTAWESAVVTNGGTVSAERKIYVNDFIIGLKQDGIWPKLDRLWLFAAENAASALTDLVANSLATAVNSPSFSANLGYTGNGTTSYIDSNAAAGSMTHYTQNSASIGYWANSDSSKSASRHGWYNSAATKHGYFALHNHDSSDNVVVAVNSSFFDELRVTAPGKLLVGGRPDATHQEVYVDGASGGPVASNSASITGLTETFWFCGRDDSGSLFAASDEQIAAGLIGGSLSAIEHNNLWLRLRRLMTQIGVP